MGFFDKHLDELDNDLDLDEIEENETEQETTKDNNSNKKSFSFKDLFKRKKKNVYLTDDDIAQNRKKVVNKGIILLSIAGFLLILLFGLIIFLQKVNAYKRYVATHPHVKKEEQTLVLENNSNTLWKLQVDNQLKDLRQNLIKNIIGIKKIVKEENNATIMALNNLIKNKINKKFDNLNEKIENEAQQFEKLKQYINQQNEATLQKAKAYTLEKSFALQTKLSQLKPVNVSITPNSNNKSNGLNSLKSAGETNQTLLNQQKLALEKAKKAEKIKKAKIAYRKKVVQVEEEVSNLNIENIPVDMAVEKHLKNNKKKSQENIPYHLMTGFTTATLITGVSAPTFSVGLLNPKPVLLSVDGRSIIANDQQENIKDCLLIGKATGNMVTSRAEILITRISCSIPTDNPYVYKKIEASGNPIGWVIGEDGKYGLRGRLVDSAGKLILRQIMVGFLQGVSQAFAPSSVLPVSNTSTSPIKNANTALTTGMANGASSAFGSLAEYYKKMLDGMYPYVDVMGGRKVTVLIKGFQDIKVTKYKKVDISQINNNSNGEQSYEVKINYNNF